jgi:hypothetical protein
MQYWTELDRPGLQSNAISRTDCSLSTPISVSVTILYIHKEKGENLFGNLGGGEGGEADVCT